VSTVNPQQVLECDKNTHVSPKARAGRALVKVWLFRLLGSWLWGKSCTTLSVTRSFLGRLHTQLSKDLVSVNLGPKLQRHLGSYQLNRRTLARKRGIESLRAIHPWADFQDLEIFLMGFDVGEQWVLCSSDNVTDPGSLGNASSSSQSNAV
jgi:hypothetical protein